ncbi:MAG TPA: DUF934 domain-containing protein [Steroidobacteraceae bacterium]|nr:DUF934 domain-containing protein [Steroidobacteraceae bacterium]
MPRRLLRDRQIVADEWLYSAEAAGNALAPLIVTVDEWLNDRETWLARGSRLGLQIAPAHKLESLVQDLGFFTLIAAEFPGPADGRGYTQGRLLRERFDFKGELRATGYVRRDQLFFLARCGFNSFELPEADIEDAMSALSTFSAAYQPSNDKGLKFKLRRGIPAGA